MRYFAEVETLGELKKEFRRLALVNHPDHGGDACIMRDIICEYQRLAKILPDIELEPEEEESPAENTPAHEAPRFYCAYAPTSAGEPIRIWRGWPRLSFPIRKSALWQRACLFMGVWVRRRICAGFTASFATS